MKEQATNKRLFRSIAAIAFILTTASSVSAQKVTGEPGSSSATTTISGKQLPPPDPKFGGVQGEGVGFDALVATARSAAEGRAQRSAHHDGRCRFRRAGHVWRRCSDTGDGSHRGDGPALHEFPLHGYQARIQS